MNLNSQYLSDWYFIETGKKIYTPITPMFAFGRVINIVDETCLILGAL